MSVAALVPEVALGRGYFGELSSPVLEADSPTGRLRDIQWNPKSRELRFMATPAGVPIRMAGVLREGRLVVSRVSGESARGLVLLKEDDPMIDWRSRAQFECAMLMWRRD